MDSAANESEPQVLYPIVGIISIANRHLIRFIKNTFNAVAEQKIQKMEIATLLLVSRPFTQSCRMQIYGMRTCCFAGNKSTISTVPWA